MNGSPQPGAIRKARKAAGLSQEKLARVVDCSTDYVRMVERGYSPDPAASPVFCRIVDYLNAEASQSDNQSPGLP